MAINRFLHNYSITWRRWELRIWRHWRWPPVELIHWHERRDDA